MSSAEIEVVEPKTPVPVHHKLLLTRSEAASLCSLPTRAFVEGVHAKQIPLPAVGTLGHRNARWSRRALEEHFVEATKRKAQR